MPFVQRNWKGEVTGLFANLQPGYAEEELPEDDLEVVAFRTAHPIPPEMLRPLSRSEIEQGRRFWQAQDAEQEALRNTIWAFNATFTDLEVALSALLHEALHVPNGSEAAYAVYYSPNGFDARAEIVHNVIEQLILENKALSELSELWPTLYKKFRSTRKMRNSLAHGFPTNLAVRGKLHARLISPPFDPIRVGRHVQQGKIPGLTASVITDGVRKARWLIKRVDDVNHLIATFHEVGNPTLPEKFLALKAGLQTTHSP